MKQFKKRTIALVLASVVTVAGSFAAGNYKNSLMALDFSVSSDNSINMVLQTKSAFAGTVNPIKKDINTYVLMLPEMNSAASTPDLSSVGGNIESVKINTMPYTDYGKGYTKITIKTANPSLKLIPSTQIFVEDKTKPVEQIAENPVPPPTPQPVAEPAPYPTRVHTTQPLESYESSVPVYNEFVQQTVSAPEEEKVSFVQPEVQDNAQEAVSGETESFEAFMLVMGIFLTLIAGVFLYVKAKNKMREIAGESLDIDISDDAEKPKKKDNIRKITGTIKKLDNAYAKTARAVDISEYTPSVKMEVKPVQDVNIVDLDELFQEHKNQNSSEENDEENAALEDFLSGFSFEDEDENTQENADEPEDVFDDELYQKTINSSKMNFSQEDISCINKLLSLEINDNTLKNINEYAVSNPITKTRESLKVLEDIVTTYVVQQNISFTGEDINTLYKLINVELDNDFITDLRTNPERVREMQQEMENRGEVSRKSREILTLNVKDMLPDLSEALRKQGGRKIESEAKPITVYASDGYEVSVLSLDGLPDLSVEINNKDAYISKPSADWEYADNTYDVDVLNITEGLPDLKDALSNPEKYEAVENVVSEEVDEESLLKNISNVQFKPFYDGSEEFEVLNDFSDTDTSEIIEEQPLLVQSEDLQDDNTANSETIDISAEEESQSVNEEEFIPAKLERPVVKKIERSKKTGLAEELLKRVEEGKTIRKHKEDKIPSIKPNNRTVLTTCEKKEFQCIFEGETYNVVSSVEFSRRLGCHLAKNDDGYIVLGFSGNKVYKLKTYEGLKSEKIQARISEKLEDGTSRYIVRIGLKKFIVEVKAETINYVMDLC